MAKATNKKVAAKKAPAKKVAAKAAPKKAAAKQAPKKAAAKAAPKKAPAKQAPKKAPAKQAPKKAAAKQAPKKAAAKQAPKKAAAKQAPKKAAMKQMPKKAAGKVAAKKVAVKAAPKKVALTDETMLQNLFSDSLKDIYYAEKSGVKALPKLAKAATSPELRSAFELHAQQTADQVQRLEQVFELLGKKATGKKCEAIEGLIREADSLVKETKKGSKTRDVALIMAAQKMEHYEIATYGSIATLAALQGLSEVKEIFGQILEQEKETDQILTQLAESSINQQAEQEGSEDEQQEQSGQSADAQGQEKDEELDPKAGDDGNTED